MRVPIRLNTRDARKIGIRGGHKYSAKRTEVDDLKFDSLKEANRYSELKMLEGAGQIKDLKVHPRWVLAVRGKTVGHYEADFSYFEGSQFIVEDVKGVRTAVYRLKKKFMAALYGIQIVEV